MFYSLIYLLLIGIFYLLMILRGSTFLWWVLRSSENLRKKALYNVLHAPMGFFLVMPVGDLLLNFTKDQVGGWLGGNHQTLAAGSGWDV